MLGLYDPDRSQTVMQEGRISSWAAFLTAMGNEKAAMSLRWERAADSDGNGDVANAGGADSAHC